MGLGDGLALLANEEGTIECISGRKTDGYANETVALGTPHKTTDWQVSLFPEITRYQTAILATDGVADDLRADKLDAFVEWIKSAGKLKQPGRGVRRVLNRWPVKSHSDDKTIAAIIWNKI
jgi:hypothetical protein